MQVIEAARVLRDKMGFPAADAKRMLEGLSRRLPRWAPRSMTAQRDCGLDPAGEHDIIKRIYRGLIERH